MQCCKISLITQEVYGKWNKIGHFGSECKQFEPLDLQQEEQDRLQKEKHDFIKSQLRQIKQENRERRKTIENEFNVNNTFFKEQLSKQINHNDTSCKND